MLGAAYSYSKVGFVALLAVSLVTDAVDGILARRWKAQSPMGRRLDHWADAFTMILGALGIYYLWPESVESEEIAVLIAAFGYLIIGFERLWRRPNREKIPTWWERGSAFFPPLSFALHIVGWSPWPFRIAAVLQVVVALLNVSRKSPRGPAGRAASQQSSNP